MSGIRKLVALLRVEGRQLRREQGIAYWRQVLGILEARRRGFEAGEYYAYDLYAGRHWDFIGTKHFNTVVRRLNPRVSTVIPFNKWLFNEYMRSQGVAVPRCVGVYHPVFGFHAGGAQLNSLDALRQALATEGALVFKPFLGEQGIGVRVIAGYDAEGDRVRFLDGDAAPLAEFMAALERECPGEAWLIQEKVAQHPQMASLHPASVNTLRMLSVMDGQGRIHVFAGLLRMGRQSQCIDNTSHGGLVALVDMATGRSGAAVDKAGTTSFARHPDTGVEIEGFLVPGWQEIQDAVTRAHRVLPFARTFGWDVALTPEGPCFLEVNSDWWHRSVQVLGGRSLWDTPFGAVARAVLRP